MKRILKSVTGIAAAAMITVGAIIPAQAVSLRHPQYFLLSVDGELYVQQSGQNRSREPLSIYSPDIRITENALGVLVLVYNESDEQSWSYPLSDQDTLTFQGNYNSVVLDAGLSASRSFTFLGRVKKLTVDSPVLVNLKAGAYVDEMVVRNTNAQIISSSQSAVGNTTTSSTSFRSSSSSSSFVNRSVSLSQRNTSTRLGRSSGRVSYGPTDLTGLSVDQYGQIQTYLTVEEADKTRQRTSFSGRVRTVNVQGTNSVSFLGQNHIALDAKGGVPLGTAIQDVVLQVRRVGDDAVVSGFWSWDEPAYASRTIDGTYIYTFTPFNPDLYESVELIVEYTNRNPSGTLAAPVLEFDEYQLDSGSLRNTTVDLRVRIPAYVEDGDSLQILADGQVMRFIDLYESDEVEYEEVTVDLTQMHGFNELQAGDRIRFRAVIVRNNTQKRNQSAYLRYTITA